jgi:uncharacterized short protein YbdD (DUF466 family)
MSTGSRLLTLVGLALLTCSLGGCGTINANLAAGVSDYVPHWAGGLPADAPPRPGSAKYEEFMREREKKRLEAAPPKDEAGAASSASLEAIH